MVALCPDHGQLFHNLVKEGLPTSRELIGLVNRSAFIVPMGETFQKPTCGPRGDERPES